MGQIYVDVAAAQAEMGIMTLESSGGGVQTGGAWLYWNENGYMGKEWYWYDDHNHLKKGWEDLVEDGGSKLSCGYYHDSSYDSFQLHVEARHAENLNAILGGWGSKEKSTFVINHPELEPAGCVQWE